MLEGPQLLPGAYAFASRLGGTWVQEVLGEPSGRIESEHHHTLAAHPSLIAGRMLVVWGLRPA